MKYGWHGPYPFQCMLEQDMRQQSYENYTADMLGIIQTSLCGLGGKKNADIPMFTDLMSRQVTKQSKITQEQVIQHLLSKL